MAGEKPLSGLRVLDLTRFYAGPFCTMKLGDHGADVVKIEPPGGDQTRRQGPPFLHDVGMTFLAANRNKRSVELDAKTEQGKRLLCRLAGAADVVVENFRPNVLTRLGIDYETVSAANPGVIYASLSALGADGPEAERGGFDITVQAEFGFMSISGEKTFISNATVADVATLLVRTGDDSFTIFLLDRSEHKFESREIEKLGLNGWSFGSIVLDELYVDDRFRLGAVGSALAEVMSGFERARAWVAVIACGIARAALDDAIAYSCTRDQFGVPIAAHQLVQALLADMACETESARLLTLRALAELDRGGRSDLATSMAKVYASEAAVRVASNAIQVHGACGVTREFPVERHMRNARMLTIPDGTTQINQLIIGRELTGIPAFLGARGHKLQKALAG